MNHSIIRAPAATRVDQFEPLMPGEAKLRPLLEQAHLLQRRSWSLASKDMPGIRKSLTPLLRAMNSYYTNKIEGQHTLPADIEGAMRNEFSGDPDRARRQRLALAHLQTEAWAEAEYGDLGWHQTYRPEVIASLHRYLYRQLPESDRVTDAGEPVLEGQFRDKGVKVGMHVAPEFQQVPAFIERWCQGYGSLPSGEYALVGLACAHHRLAWVHPFRDGNGRIARLHSHLGLHGMGLTGGIWSIMRGLARRQQAYYDRLIDADELRRGDFDGRGVLSEQGLISFAEFFLDTCLDQVGFMEEMLDLRAFKERLDALLTFESSRADSGLRREGLNPLHYMAMTGLMERGEFKTMTGLGEKTAERLLGSLLTFGLVRSDTPKGKLYFGVPIRGLRFLFPNLWPEAEAMS